MGSNASNADLLIGAIFAVIFLLLILAWLIIDRRSDRDDIFRRGRALGTESLRYGRLFVGAILTVAFAVFVAFFASKIDLSGSHRWNAYDTWFAGLSFAAVALEVLKEIGDEQSRRGEFSHAVFNRTYTRSLTTAFDSYIAIRDGDRQQTISALKDCLRAVSSVIAAYHSKDGLNVNATIFLRTDTSEYSPTDFHDRVHFTYRENSPDIYRCVLKVAGWGRDQADLMDFALPVHRDPKQVLFGAPKTFMTGERDHVFDTSSIRSGSRHIADQPRSVKDAVVAYFKNAQFSSFATLAVGHGSDCSGVLSIQSSKKYVFGATPEKEEEIEEYIRPFCSVLHMMISRLAYLDSLSAQEGSLNATARARTRKNVTS